LLIQIWYMHARRRLPHSPCVYAKRCIASTNEYWTPWDILYDHAKRKGVEDLANTLWKKVNTCAQRSLGLSVRDMKCWLEESSETFTRQSASRLCCETSIHDGSGNQIKCV
jgi:hypothetical protein